MMDWVTFLNQASNEAAVTGIDCSFHICSAVSFAPFIILQASFGGIVTTTVGASKSSSPEQRIL